MLKIIRDGSDGDVKKFTLVFYSPFVPACCLLCQARFTNRCKRTVKYAVGRPYETLYQQTFRRFGLIFSIANGFFTTAKNKPVTSQNFFELRLMDCIFSFLYFEAL